MGRMSKAYRFIAALVLFFLPIVGWADGPLHVVKKNITKSYIVKTGTQLSINNQYGNVSLKGWKQKQLLIKITIFGQSQKLVQAKQNAGIGKY
jgi:hypothetical protein